MQWTTEKGIKRGGSEISIDAWPRECTKDWRSGGPPASNASSRREQESGAKRRRENDHDMTADTTGYNERVVKIPSKTEGGADLFTINRESSAETEGTAGGDFTVWGLYHHLPPNLNNDG